MALQGMHQDIAAETDSSRVRLWPPSNLLFALIFRRILRFPGDPGRKANSGDGRLECAEFAHDRGYPGGTVAPFGDGYTDGARTGRSRVSGWCAPGQRGDQVDLVPVPQHAVRIRLSSVDDEQYRVVKMLKGQPVEEVPQRASGRKREVCPPQRPIWSGPLQGGVQMDDDGDVYQLNMLSRSASDAS